MRHFIVNHTEPNSTVADWKEAIKTSFGITYYNDMMVEILQQYAVSYWVYELQEQYMYGSSRLGSVQRHLPLVQQVLNTDSLIYYSYTNDSIRYMERGQKRFELSNHLGNVLAVVTDRKLVHCSEEELMWFDAQIVSVTDYYPFGMEIKERTYSVSSYRFGFNSMERDDEIYGAGNSYTAEFWQYDSRLGRRWNIDPVVKSWESSYATFANNPIFFIDPNGDNAGDFYNKDGQHLGSDGIDDDKVYVADDVTKNDKGLVTGSTNSQELNITHSEFQKNANIVKHESSGDKTESLWIAHTANNAKGERAVFGIHSTLYGQLTAKYNEKSKYSSVSDLVKNTPLATTDNSSAANNARAGVINVLMGGADPTGGAVLWDGTDFLTNGVNHNKFKEAVSITMTGSHFSAYQTGVGNYMPKLTTHSSLSRSNVYLPSNAPNGPVNIPEAGLTFRNDYGWMGGNFYGQGKGKSYHYSTTGGQGASLFWRITPK